MNGLTRCSLQLLSFGIICALLSTAAYAQKSHPLLPGEKFEHGHVHVGKDTCHCDTFVKAQLRLCDSVRCCIEHMAHTLKNELPRMGYHLHRKKQQHSMHDSLYDKLVTNHTYRRYFAKDMAKILSFDNAISTGTRYATVSVDEDKSTFNFSPFTTKFPGRQEPDEVQKPTWGFANVYLKGKVNNAGVAELTEKGKWNKEFTLGGTLVVLLGSGGGDWYNEYEGDPCEIIHKRNFRRLQQVLPDELCRKYQGKYDDIVTAGNVFTYAEYTEMLKDCKSVQAAMRKEYSDIEEKLAEPLWTWRWRQWLAFSPEIGWNSLALLDTLLPATPLDTGFVTGSFRMSYNLFFQHKKWWGKPSFYFSPSIMIRSRNQFSELSTKTWNKYRYIQSTDSSVLFTKSSDVYLYDGGAIEHKVLPTFATQLLGIWNADRFGFGFDISFAYESLFTKPGADKNSKFTHSYGLVLPFNDKKGERTINITIFYQHDNFKIAAMEDLKFFGLRFAVPIFSASE